MDDQLSPEQDWLHYQNSNNSNDSNNNNTTNDIDNNDNNNNNNNNNNENNHGENTASSAAPRSCTQNGHSNSSEPACDQCRSRKVRCDRQQPKCSNCRKAKLACGFSNKGKRVNHTTKLVNNVDVLRKRMDKFEAAIGRCVNAVEQHISLTTTSLQSTKAKSSDEDVDVLETTKPRSAPISGGQSPANSEDRVLELEQKNRYLVTESGGYERFFGSGSMYSIWIEIISTTEQLFARSSSEAQNPQILQRSSNLAVVAALSPDLKSALQRACDHLQRYCAEPPAEECSDRDSLSLPPRFLLETFLEPFLKELNPILPILSRSSLLEAIRIQYDSPQEQVDPAWATCFNNLILHILTMKAGGGNVESLSRNAMDDSLRMTFLMNAQRSYSNLGALLKPRVVNVQAFLSMALVALKYYRYPVFETLFALACQLAKVIGLHQQVDSASSRDTSEAERINLFWTLFVMDKQLALMSGKSCHLQGFDCDVPLPSPEVTSDMPLRDHWVAAIKLAFINEDIYRNLYSAESARASDAHRQRMVKLLTQNLRNWTTLHQQLLVDNESRSSEKWSFSLELRYSMLSSEILVLRRSKSRESKVQLLSDARAGLNIIKRLCQASITIASNFALERIFLHYPLVTFVDLYKNTIEDVSMTSPEDAPLLAFVAERISNQAATPSRLSYMAKLKTVTALCSAVCISIKRTKEPNAATGPNFSTLSPPKESSSGLGDFAQSSDPFSSLSDMEIQTLGGNKQTMPKMGSTSGDIDFPDDFQLQYLANAPTLTNQSSSDNYDVTSRISPFFSFQPEISASQTTHEPPQKSLPQDWPPTISSDQMDLTSYEYLDNFEAI